MTFGITPVNGLSEDVMGGVPNPRATEIELISDRTEPPRCRQLTQSCQELRVEVLRIGYDLDAA